MPRIVLNIIRDEIVVEPAVVDRTEVTKSTLEAIEPAEESVNWQDVTYEDKLKAEQQAIEQRVMAAKKIKAN